MHYLTIIDLCWGEYGVVWVWNNNIEWGEAKFNIVIEGP